MTTPTEICGQNGHYVSKPCTAQELIDWIRHLDGYDSPEWHHDAWRCLLACKAYLEWYQGS